MAPRVDTEYWNAIAKARVELHNLISKEKYSASDLLRLAYASQFSIANFHHANEEISTPTDATQSANNNNNNNLKTAIESIKRNNSKITYPDLYQLAGVVALETLGGPEIKFVPGREDLAISPDEGCLPDVSVKDPSDLRGVFHRVGISNSDLIVALCGGLKLARRADAEKSGVQGPRTEEKSGVQGPHTEEKSGVQAPRTEEKSGVQAPRTEEKSGVQRSRTNEKSRVQGPHTEEKSGVQRSRTNEKSRVQGPPTEETLKFDNSYFKELLDKKVERPIDKALLNDEEFRKHVDLYATDEDAFKTNYVVAHKKLSELGLPSFFGFEGVMTQRAVGVAVAAAVVILSVFYLINRRKANKYSSQQF